jgi:hypothetical protein
MRLVHPDIRSTVRYWKAIQMIPMRQMMATERTPHHTARMPYFNNTVAQVNNPLDMEPYACWGGFSPIIFACGDECDVIELFRNIYIYLCRYDPHSPLARVNREMTERFKFAERIE